MLGAPLQTPTQPWLVPHCCNLVSNPPPTLPPSSALQQSGIRGEGGRCRHQSRARPLPEGGPGGSRRAQRPVTAGLVTCGGQPGSAPTWIACIMNWAGAASQQQRLYTTSGQSVPLASSNVHPHTVQQCTPTHIQTHTPTCKYISKSATSASRAALCCQSLPASWRGWLLALPAQPPACEPGTGGREHPGGQQPAAGGLHRRFLGRSRVWGVQSRVAAGAQQQRPH